MTPNAPTLYTRLHDWQPRYEAFVRARLSAPFAWGGNDCCTFAADGVQAITGIDPAPHLRAHRDARGALLTMRGCGGIAKLAIACMGPAQPATRAAVGDMVLLPMGKRLALGLCNGSTAFGPSAHGLAHVAMADALLCWRLV